MKILTAMGKGLKSLFLPELCRCAVCGEEREMVENTGFCQRMGMHGVPSIKK